METYKFLAAVALCISSLLYGANREPQQIEVVTGKAQQTYKGWGFTLAPVDWDGMLMARNRDICIRLIRDFRPTIVRLTLGSTHEPMFSENSGRLNELAAEKYLGVYVRSIMAARVNRYILTIRTPPKWMKKYALDAPHLYLDSNSIRIGYHDEYIEMIVSVIKWLRSNDMQLPSFLSLQEQPDCPSPAFECPPSLPQGCIYSPQSYKHMADILRKALDDAGLNDILLIGPETWKPESAEAYFSPSLSGLFFISAAGRMGNSFTASIRYSGPLITRATMGREPTTMLTIFELAKNLTYDLCVSRANYWLWPYGFAQEDNGEVLRYGNQEHNSPICDAVKTILGMIPVDGAVSPLYRRMPLGREELCGFSISDKNRTCYLLYNSYPEDCVFRCGLREVGKVTVTVFGDGKSNAIPTHGQISVFLKANQVAAATIWNQNPTGQPMHDEDQRAK